jgi:probable metal-binding protein
MSEQIHGHEVMQMLIDANEPQSKSDFKEKIDQKYGQDAKFFTCSAKDLSSIQLIEFLEGKGKFFNIEGKILTDTTKVCNH